MIQWDEAKRTSNLAKHALDFADAIQIFDGRARLDVPARRDGEERTLSIATLDGLCITIIWTWLDGERRIISARRARREERQAFGSCEL